MPWYFPWSDSIKKRACRYLLQRYLGHFLKEKLTLDQLSVDLYNGKGTIKDLLLDVVSLNEALDSYNVPFEIVDGFIGSMTVDIPWAALVNANTHVEVHNLELTIQPKQRDDCAGVMLESMFSSMTSSLELAQECLRQDPTEGEQHAETAQPFEGLEMFAMTIEAVLTRIKMTFADTVVRLEHLPKDSETGAALELRISRIEYFDDIANDPGTSVDQPDASSKPVYEIPAISHKNIHLTGVTLFCDEFPAIYKTVSRVISMDSGTQDKEAQSTPTISPPFCLNLDEKAVSDSGGIKESDPIKVAVLMGKQELKLKIKQNDELPGPKMEVESNLGIMNIHLSPRQVHLLSVIADGLTTPGQSGAGGLHTRHPVNRPMDPEDEERVEQELQKRLQTERLTHYEPAGWQAEEDFANQCLDDSEDEMYFDLDNQSVSMSMTSSISSASTVKSSNTAQSGSYLGRYPRREAPFQMAIPRNGRSQPKSRHKESLHKLLDDTATQLAKYKLRISFISAIVLHEDPPSTPGDALDPGQTSLEKLHIMADKYFGRVQGINTSGFGTTLASLRTEFSKACGVDHISFLGKPLTLECFQRCTSSAMTTEAELTLGIAELIEVLFDHRGATATASLMGIRIPLTEIPPEYSELLTFPQDEVPKTQSMFSSMHTASVPCIRVKITTGYKTHQTPRRRSAGSSPKTEVHMEFTKCISELDISLVDRIHALLNPEPLAKCVNSVYMSAYKSFSNPAQTQQNLFSQTIDESPSASDKPLDFRLSCSNCTIALRFPIPDLRSGQGIDKPWWRRHLHQEQLLFQFTDAELHTKYQGEPQSEIDFTCREAKVSLQESCDTPPVQFIYLSKADSSTHERDEEFDWPRLELKLYPKQQSQLEQVIEEVEDLSYIDSLNGACQFEKPPPSPFSKKKVLYDNDELVLPGDRQETAEFQEQAVSKTQMSLDLTLPNISIYFKSKAFFELIYNRVLNDLVLWEPTAPAPLDVTETYSSCKSQGWSLNTVSPFVHSQQTELFSLCKSGIQYDSSSESDDGLEDFCSINEYRSRQRQKQVCDKGGKSKLCLNLNITRGRITALMDCKNEDNQPKPGYHGELCFDVEEGSFFTVLQTNGDPELQHMCLHVHRAALYQADEVVDETEPPEMTRVPGSLVPPEHLVPTMYLSDRGVETSLTGQVGTGGDTMDMLSLAVQVKIDLVTNVEECIVAIGIRGTTLLHRMLPSNHSWFDQMVDFLDVKDFPILGYTKPAVLTQLHAHLYGCAIDYRPLYLPYRTLVTFETFSICSNVVAESPTSKLRFRIEDGALYISQYARSKEVNLRQDYVCVADVGLFELILTTSDGRDARYPKLELKASNNILHIRTCSDSCQALAELINYLADNGDLVYDGSNSALLQSASTSSLSESPQLSQSHMEQVHDMMADAMKESTTSSPEQSLGSSPEKHTKPVEVFFFPGEEKVASLSGESPGRMSASSADSFLPERYSDEESDDANAAAAAAETSTDHSDGISVLGQHQVAMDTILMEDSDRDVPDDDPDASFNPDDEFCIIDDAGLGIAPKDGEPKIRSLTESAVQIVDNHFEIPLGRGDQLRAPKHFPNPQYRYTLQEMSLVWYIYGGEDFTNPKKTRGSSSDTHTAKYKQSLGKAGWQARGGINRDIDTLMELQLNKVRLQHEVYPENTVQASRQILLIHELEIRDRLASSKINKFLYQYTSESLPKQSHANMVLVKAVHIRPDPSLPAEECTLRVSVQPLRLNIDQDALFFLRRFFMEISEGSFTDSKTLTPGPGVALAQKPSAPLPVMSVGQTDTTEKPPDLVKFDEMLEALEEEEVDEEDEQEVIVEEGMEKPQQQPIFFKSFIFSPDVPIRLDYHGKRVDMEQGTLAGLLVGLAQLNCSELRLKRLHQRHGLLGFSRLVLYALNEWLKDIKRNQLPSILGGVGPMHSLVQLVQGLRDLFWLPMEQYKKDGRIIRGIQRGAHSFATCTAMSALEITNRLVQTVQYCAEVAFDMISPGPSVRKKKYRRKLRRLTHPADLREGFSNAYHVVTEGVMTTAQTIYHTAVDEHEQKGVSGAIGGVLRQLPPTMLQPVILATEATSSVLGGMRNQLLPDKKKEDEEKWKPEEET